jgi:uncharacterized protein YbjT (DUF2867 family)
VTGATGKQGGAAARALLARGTPVRALVRDRTSEAARAVETLRADLVQGDLDDPAPLGAAVADVRAVFSVQTPDLVDLASDAERVRGRKLVDAARDAGVPQFVHTSVSGAGDHHRAAAGWAQGRWNTDYWESKAATDESVRGAGFRHRTILRPATFTENFVRPSSYFVNWVEDRFRLAPAADTRLPLIAVRDIGAAVAAAVADPEKFHGRVVQLAGDHLTMARS